MSIYHTGISLSIEMKQLHDSACEKGPKELLTDGNIPKDYAHHKPFLLKAIDFQLQLFLMMRSTHVYRRSWRFPRLRLVASRQLRLSITYANINIKQVIIKLSLRTYQT